MCVGGGGGGGKGVQIWIFRKMNIFLRYDGICGQFFFLGGGGGGHHLIRLFLRSFKGLFMVYLQNRFTLLGIVLRFQIF